MLFIFIVSSSVLHIYIYIDMFNHSAFLFFFVGSISNQKKSLMKHYFMGQKFDEWMQTEVLDKGASFTFVTCGDWDLKTM